MSRNRIVESIELKKPLLSQEDRKQTIVVPLRPTPSTIPTSKLQSKVSKPLLNNVLKFSTLADQIALRQTSIYFHSHVQPFLWYSDILVNKLKQLEDQFSKYPELATQLDEAIGAFVSTLNLFNLSTQIELSILGLNLERLHELSDSAPGSGITNRLKPLHSMKAAQLKSVSFSFVVKNKPERLLQECQNTHTILNRLETIRSQFITTTVVMNPTYQGGAITVSACMCGTAFCLGGCLAACCAPTTIAVAPPYSCGAGCFTGIVGHILGDANRIFYPATTTQKTLEKCGYVFDCCFLGANPLNDLFIKEYKDIADCRRLLNALSRDQISYQALIQLRKLNNKFKEEKIVIQENRKKDKDYNSDFKKLLNRLG